MPPDAPATALQLARERADQPEVRALIDALDAYQKPLYPPASHHGVDIATLLAPDVIFAVARNAHGAAVGCGGVQLAPHWGELKRMYVQPGQRGLGVGRALLGFIEAEAMAAGCRLFVLETGYLQHEAIGLYMRAGYTHCPPFGDYVDDPNSVFMRKAV